MSGSDDGGLDIHYPAMTIICKRNRVGDVGQAQHKIQRQTRKKEKRMRATCATEDDSRRSISIRRRRGASSGVGVASSLISSDWHTGHVDDQ